MNLGGIYQIENQINGKCYIGSTINLGKRWRDHLSRLRRGQHPNPHLQAAFDKYGEKTFVFTVLESIRNSMELIPREQYYLDTLKPEYNICSVAGSPLGFRHTDETRQKISLARSGKPLSEEHRRKLSNAWTPERRQALSKRRKGLRLSKEGRRKLSEAHMGKPHPRRGVPHTDATKRKISEALKGRSRSEKTKRKLSEAGKAYWRRVHGALL